MIDGNIDVVSLTGDITDSVSLEGELLPIGPKGDKGDPGFSPVVTTSKSGKTTTVKFETATGNVYAYIQDGEDGQGSGDMLKEVYDANNNGIVDNAEKVNNHTVEKDVPANADFSDTKAIWGNITGTLTNQTDLNTALGNKANTSDLSTVATSGSYNDLSNKPTNVSTFTNDANYVTSNGNAETTQSNVSSATFTNTLEAPMNIDLKGNTLQNGTPTPSSPIPINNVSGDNEIVVCGKNLFDKDSVAGGFVNADGTIGGDTNAYRTSDFIPIQQNTAYYKTRTDSPRTKYYDSNKQPLNTTTYQDISIGGNEGTFTTPNNAYYLRFSYPISSVDANTIMLYKGSTSTTYEAYNGTTYNIDLPVENLFDKDGDFTFGNTNYATSLNEQGQIVSTSNYYAQRSAGQKISNLSKNTDYTCSGTLISANGTGTNNAVIEIRSEDNTTRLIQYQISNNVSKPYNFTFTFNTGNFNSIYVSINGMNNSASGTTTTIYDNIQIEQGSKANTYTPYGTTPIELNKIGTYQDYFYKENDKWYLHKEIGKYTFTGEENFTWDSDKQRIIIPISNLGINTPPLTTSQPFNVYNQKVIGTTFDNLYNKVVDNCIALSTGNSISIRSTSFDSLNTGKSTIANTDLYYLLATPTNTEITYTPLIEQLNAIFEAQSKQGTTNITQVNNDLPFILDLSVFNDTYNGRYESLVEQIPNNDNLVNVGTSVDTGYKVNVLTTKNLFDYANVNYRVGYILNDSGVEITDRTGGYTRNYSQVQPNTEYIFSYMQSGSGNRRLYFYDINKNFINRTSLISTSSTTTFTTPSNAYYVNVQTYTPVDTNLSTWQLEQGNQATTYEPFIKNTINVNNEKYTDTINVGTSINDKNRVNVLYSHNLFDKNNANVLNAYFVDGTNNITTDTSGNNKTIYIPCKPNTTYTIQKTASPSNRAIGYTTTTPAVNVAVQGAINILANTTSKIITTGNNAQYLVIRVWSGTQDTITFQEMLDSVMINEGSEALSYEPYVVPSINVDGDEIYNQNIMNYSTSEIRIGTWIDGKPLYRKIYNFTTPSSADVDSVIFTAPNNIDTMVNLYGMLISANARFTLNSYYSTSYYIATYYNPNDGIRVKVGSSLVNRSAVAILEYTKTTD